MLRLMVGCQMVGSYKDDDKLYRESKKAKAAAATAKPAASKPKGKGAAKGIKVAQSAGGGKLAAKTSRGTARKRRQAVESDWHSEWTLNGATRRW